MQPQIVTKPAFTVVGLRLQTTPMSPEIPQLWDQFVPRMAEIQQGVEPGVSYGLMSHSEDMSRLDYMAGSAVETVVDLPAGMMSWTVPANTYAVFETTLATIGETFGYVYNTWLPTSGYRQAAGPYFERYPETFDPEGNSALAIYLPIEKQA
jgi:AraC family transcriptional regulator